MKQRTLRRTFAIVLLPVLIFTLAACSGDAIQIEDYQWKMRTVMSNDIELADSNAVVLAVGEYDVLYPDAKIVDLTLIAKSGKLTMTDATNDMVYEGTYKVLETNTKGTDYEISVDGKTGYANVSMTEYYEGEDEPTLSVNLGDCSVYFYQKQQK